MGIYSWKNIIIMLEARSMRSNLAIILLLSCIISISTVMAFSQEPKCKKVLLIFSADWCHYCQKAKEDMQTDPVLSNIMKNYEIVNIDFDNEKEIVRGHNIKMIPAFIIFNDGTEINRQIGYRNSRELNRFLK